MEFYRVSQVKLAVGQKARTVPVIDIKPAGPLWADRLDYPHDQSVGYCRLEREAAATDPIPVELVAGLASFTGQYLAIDLIEIIRPGGIKLTGRPGIGGAIQLTDAL